MEAGAEKWWGKGSLWWAWDPVVYTTARVTVNGALNSVVLPRDSRAISPVSCLSGWG